MSLRLSVQALYILAVLRRSGYQAYIVGGAVRDILLQAQNDGKTSRVIEISDYDFTTDATPEQIQAIFTDSFYENQFGTVSVAWEHLNQQLLDEWKLKADHLSVDKEQPPTETFQKVIDVAQATKLHESFEVPETADTQSHSKEKFEITTFRADGEYHNFRHPKTVAWSTTLEADLERRDFTINALAISVTDTWLESVPSLIKKQKHEGDSFGNPTLVVPEDTYQVLDYHDGVTDLKAGLIKAVGDPTTRFKEDALRMLRAIRFSAQLNMAIDLATFEAITAQAELIKHVSGERIRDELLKMLASNYPAEAIEMLDETGLLPFILPEILEAKGVQQAGHHTTDVWVHSLDALATCPSPDPIVRLATLLHDVAKPRTQEIKGNTITFYNHEIVGARMVKDIAYRLKFSKEEINRLYILVRHHMFYYQPENTDAAIRRFMRKVGLEYIDDILDLREADRLGSGARKTSWRLEEMKQRMIQQLHQPMDIKDLALNGHDLMETFSLEPGRVLGETLHYLFELVFEKPELNTKDQLLDLARDFLDQAKTSSQTKSKGAAVKVEE